MLQCFSVPLQSGFYETLQVHEFPVQIVKIHITVVVLFMLMQIFDK